MFCFYAPWKPENLWLHKHYTGLKWVKHIDLVFLLITLNKYWPSTKAASSQKSFFTMKDL